MNEAQIAEHVARVERPLVITHAHCADGWCAWMIARRRWPDAEVLECVYDASGVMDESEDGHPGVHVVRSEGGNQDFTSVVDRDVILLDFSFSPRDMLALGGAARSLLVLDHHASARRDVDAEIAAYEKATYLRVDISDDVERELIRAYRARFEFFVFDSERSGAGLALDAFFPGHRTREHAWPGSGGRIDIPFDEAGERGQEDWHWSYLARLVEDRDLWRFRLDGSREINAALGVLPRTVEAWEGIRRISDLEDEGRAMLRMQAALVERMADHAREVEWSAGVRAVTCNASCLQSEVGEFLYGKYPERVVCVWYRHEDGQIAGSLRSSPTGPDVGQIAKRLGGGGHAHAAGFRCDDEREIAEGRTLTTKHEVHVDPAFPIPRVSG